jgi:hypothetical protein
MPCRQVEKPDDELQNSMAAAEPPNPGAEQNERLMDKALKQRVGDLPPRGSRSGRISDARRNHTRTCQR